MPAEKAEIGAKIVALELHPGRRIFMFLNVPIVEIGEGVLIIALRVSGRRAVGRKMSKETFDALVNGRHNSKRRER
jgi:hypothetical protein